MEINTGAERTTMEVTYRDTIHTGKEKLLGEVPKVMEPKAAYKKGELIFITAFIKGEEGKFYVCRARIIELPEIGQRQIFKVLIEAVSDRAVGSIPTPTQAALLGRTIVKRENEISKDLPSFMIPKNWITIKP